MTPTQIVFVQSSFEKVVPIAPKAAALFYERLFEILFEIFPEASPMFKSDIAEQARKLIATLGTVIRSLDRLDHVMPAVKNLAIRHVAFGVEPEYYVPVGTALIWTLEQGLGADFTAEVCDAGKTGYGMLSAARIATAYPNANIVRRPIQ